MPNRYEAQGASHQSVHTGEIKRLIQREMRNALRGMTQNIYEPQQRRDPQFTSNGTPNYSPRNRRTSQGVPICNNCGRRGHSSILGSNLTPFSVELGRDRSR